MSTLCKAIKRMNALALCLKHRKCSVPFGFSFFFFLPPRFLLLFQSSFYCTKLSLPIAVLLGSSEIVLFFHLPNWSFSICVLHVLYCFCSCRRINRRNKNFVNHSHNDYIRAFFNFHIYFYSSRF